MKRLVQVRECLIHKELERKKLTRLFELVNHGYVCAKSAQVVYRWQNTHNRKKNEQLYHHYVNFEMYLTF